MNEAHLHLIINHLPIFATILGAFVLGHGLFTKSNQTKVAAYNVLIIAAVGACIAYFTGEGAEDAVKNLPDILKTAIHQHEDYSLIALIAIIILGLAAIVGLFSTLRNSSLTRTIAYIVLLLSIICIILIGKASELGGKIRHATEISS